MNLNQGPRKPLEMDDEAAEIAKQLLEAAYSRGRSTSPKFSIYKRMRRRTQSRALAAFAKAKWPSSTFLVESVSKSGA
jgi:transcription initiation factor TFIIIB Brf1 subunit/transcription initiation factor TFIIB